MEKFEFNANIAKFKANLINDVAVELLDLFNQNFDQQGFFGAKWQSRRGGDNGRAILTGKGKSVLKNSIRAIKTENSVKFVSALPYSRIHNYGGTIPITTKMRKFAWWMFRTTKDPKWKGIALTKKSVITMPQRQFMGNHPVVERAIRAIIDDNMREELSNI